MLRDKVLGWCREQNLLPEGAAVVAALSGGPDSVAMLSLLLSLRGELGLTVRAAHYNHRLRGAASDADEEFCRALCGQLGVPLACGGGDAAASARETGQSLETAARRLRYRFLLSQDGLVATAHTAGDNLETVLLNLTRGTALRGLGGIPPRRGRVIRPLLCLTRREIEAYLTETGLPFVSDETNAQGFCRRNRLRQTAVPALLRENPSLLRNLPHTLAALREDEALLQAQAASLLAAAAQGGGWAAEPLAAAPRPLRRRALRAILEDAGLRDVTLAHLERAEALLHSGPSARIDLPGGLVLRRSYGLLLAGAPAEEPFAPFQLPVPGSAALSGGRTLLCRGPLPYDGASRSFLLRLPEAPLVRTRRPGDRLRLSGGGKSVKKWMIDRKLPAAARGALPVFELRGTVIAVWGVGIDPAYRPAPGEPCYQLQILEPEVDQLDAPE